MAIITLSNGLATQEAAIVLAVDLESRGHALTADHGVLKVSDGSRLTEQDRADIKRFRNHLLAIADYGQEDAYEPARSADSAGADRAISAERGIPRPERQSERVRQPRKPDSSSKARHRTLFTED